MTTVAVIGGGAAGIGAARQLLREGFRVILIEAAPHLGGNCIGVEVQDRHGERHVLDAGVSDFNRTTFHGVSRLIDELGLPTRPIGTDAHFASVEGESLWACRSGEWTFRTPLAGSERLAGEMRAFRTRAVEVLENERFLSWSVERYLDHIGASRALRTAYLLPRAIGCFPMPDGDPKHFSVRSLVRFWNIHGIVSREPADRHCVVGGMHRYVRAFERWFETHGGTLLRGARVQGISRDAQGVLVRTVDANDRHRGVRADHVLFAIHAHQALAALEQPSREERAILASFRYQRARVLVHRDPRLMGSDPELWGAFHYVVPRGPLPRVRPTITFYPHRLAGAPEEVSDVFVTMNPHLEPRPDRVLLERYFLHPLATAANERAIARSHVLQGRRRTWFAGSHLMSPYVHESALQSGIEAARRLIAAESGALPVIGASALLSA